VSELDNQRFSSSKEIRKRLVASINDAWIELVITYRCSIAGKMLKQIFSSKFCYREQSSSQPSSQLPQQSSSHWENLSHS